MAQPTTDEKKAASAKADKSGSTGADNTGSTGTAKTSPDTTQNLPQRRRPTNSAARPEYKALQRDETLTPAEREGRMQGVVFHEYFARLGLIAGVRLPDEAEGEGGRREGGEDAGMGGDGI